jgi:hypothetical protein
MTTQIQKQIQLSPKPTSYKVTKHKSRSGAVVTKRLRKAPKPTETFLFDQVNVTFVNKSPGYARSKFVFN